MARKDSSQVEKDFVNDWMHEIQLGIKYKKATSDCSKWPEWRARYRGDYGQTLKDDYIVNKVFSYIKSAIPRVYFRTPSISATARRPEMAAHGRIVELLDNWLVQETQLKKYLKSAILDAFLCGIGIIKLGYDSEFGYVNEQQVAANQSTITQVGMKSGEAIEYNNNIQPGMPWGCRVNPDDIVTPWGYTDPDALPWIAHGIIRPLEDVKQDQKYDKIQASNLKGGFTIPEDRAKRDSIWAHGDKNNYCLLWEIRDLKRKRIIVVCEDRLLLDAEDALQIDGSPYEFIIFNEDPDRFWPIPDVKMFMPQQDEINDIRRYARKARKANLLKFLYRKGVITPENLDKLLSDDLDDAMAGIEVNSENILGEIHMLVPSGQLTDTLIRELQQADADMRDTMGFSQNQAGEFVPFHNKTATEANIVQEASSIRSDERRDIVADVLSRVMRKFNQFIFSFWDKERVAEIVGMDGLRYWVSYSGVQLKGEYDLVINPETGQPVSRAMRQQVAQNMFALFNQDPLIDQIGLRRLVLQQTDLIDPGYQNLIRVDPTQMMNPALQGGQSPIPVGTIDQDTKLRSQILGR